MDIKKLFFFILLSMFFFGSGLWFGWYNNSVRLLQPPVFSPRDNKDYILNLIHQGNSFSTSGIARIPGIFDGFSGDRIAFIDKKGQRHNLSTNNLATPVRYWAALDNDLDVPISKDSFVQGAKIIVTLTVDLYNGEIKTIWLELNKSRS